MIKLNTKSKRMFAIFRDHGTTNNKSIITELVSPPGKKLTPELLWHKPTSSSYGNRWKFSIVFFLSFLDFGTTVKAALASRYLFAILKAYVLVNTWYPLEVEQNEVSQVPVSLKINVQNQRILITDSDSWMPNPNYWIRIRPSKYRFLL